MLKMERKEKDWSGSSAETVFLIASPNAGKFSEQAVQNYHAKRWILLSKGLELNFNISIQTILNPKISVLINYKLDREQRLK